MYVSWFYQCDMGHSWEYRLGLDEEPGPESGYCPQGRHEAVTLSRQPQADRVIVQLIPAARIADSVTGNVHLDDEFYVGIASLDGRLSDISVKSFPWSDAVRRPAELRGRSWDDATRVWARMGLGLPAEKR